MFRRLSTQLVKRAARRPLGYTRLQSMKFSSSPNKKAGSIFYEDDLSAVILGAVVTLGAIYFVYPRSSKPKASIDTPGAALKVHDEGTSIMNTLKEQGASELYEDQGAQEAKELPADEKEETIAAEEGEPPVKVLEESYENLEKVDKEQPLSGEKDEELSTSGGSPQEDSQQAAYNPDTGEINWDCPCLGGMAHGPCGEEFKAAFSCFVYSTEEPRGIECVEKFQGMQECFRRYPEHYAKQLEDEDEASKAHAEQHGESSAERDAQTGTADEAATETSPSH